MRRRTFAGSSNPSRPSIPGTRIGEHMPMMAQHLDKATLIRSMSYTPNGLFNHTAAIYQMLTGYPPDRVSPSGQLEPPSPADFPTAGSHVSKLKPPNDPVLPFVELPRPLQESGIIGKGGSGRIPGQGLRSVSHVSGPGQTGEAGRSVAAQGHPAGTLEGSLRVAQRHQRFDAGPARKH